MYDRCYNGINVRYYGIDDELSALPENCRFVLAKTKPENIDRIIALEKQGFCFHDRTVLGELALNSMDPRLERVIRANIQEDGILSADIYQLAETAFVHDRRFHLEKHFNQSFAKKIISGYIDHCGQKDIKIFKCLHKGELIGFTIVELRENGICENVLGAVAPLYQSSGAAINLYAYMMEALKNAGYSKLLGRISTSNVASLNLHIALGAMYHLPEDNYILRR